MGLDGGVRVAIQGERGSNSHMAALRVAADWPDRMKLVPCATAVELFERMERGEANLAVLPIENSLHGSVFEHLDLLLESELTIVGETLLPIRHNVIAAPGVRLAEIRRVMSHPVALSQCRKWLRAHADMEVVPAYDTAGAVKQVMAGGWRDVAGIAPELAAREYGAEVLVAGVEDHRENYTRFLTLVSSVVSDPAFASRSWSTQSGGEADKVSLAFALEHRPGSLLGALEVLAGMGANLTRIESRPVPGRPFEYVFFVDFRFEDAGRVDAGLAELRDGCEFLRELGRFRAGVPVGSSSESETRSMQSR